MIYEGGQRIHRRAEGTRELRYRDANAVPGQENGLQREAEGRKEAEAQGLERLFSGKVSIRQTLACDLLHRDLRPKSFHPSCCGNCSETPARLRSGSDGTAGRWCRSGTSSAGSLCAGAFGHSLRAAAICNTE